MAYSTRRTSGSRTTGPAFWLVCGVLAGVVAFAGSASVFGELVIIDHGGEVQSLYGHNSVLEVDAGDWVEPGQEIARVGSTGESSASHLHFEIRRRGQPVDPRRYLVQ